MPRWIKPARRLAIYARDRFRYVYCNRGEDFCRSKFTLDHVEPKNRFGDNATANLVTCCIPCNRAKGARNVHEWLRDNRRSATDRARILRRVRVTLARPISMELGRRLCELMKSSLWEKAEQPRPPPRRRVRHR